ncbi:MAG: sigma-70 family RNA polymerase sigma factor [Bacteroidales bacterium]|nr:sigma-70 family RNA polymerase sigma factor [Bacteroidales bacterium]
MSLTGIKDRDIIESIKTGRDTKVLEQIYARVFPKIRKYIRKNSGSEDDAFDIFQDGMVVFYNHVVTGKFKEDCEISGFIYTVCKNLWINKCKHEKRMLKMDGITETHEEEENVLSLMIKKEREAEVQQILAQLGERCRELLQLVFFVQMSTREICEKMGFANEDTLKTKKIQVQAAAD